MVAQPSNKKSYVYFAYGTLLDVDTMRIHCPTAEPIGIMRLPGYRLGFTACAAEPSTGGPTLEEASEKIRFTESSISCQLRKTPIMIKPPG